MTEGLELREVTISTEPHAPDDVPFRIRKTTYYMGKKSVEQPDFLTGIIIRELNAAYRKIADLEKKIAKLKIKAARLEGYREGQKSVQRS